MQSLSARRAWIEIDPAKLTELCKIVALRKESVDRNRVFYWLKVAEAEVALRKESVDRNPLNYLANGGPIGRSPQGERG